MKAREIQRLDRLVGSIDILITRLSRPEYDVVALSKSEAIAALQQAQEWVDEMSWLIKREHWPNRGRRGRPPGKSK